MNVFVCQICSFYVQKQGHFAAMFVYIAMIVVKCHTNAICLYSGAYINR